MTAKETIEGIQVFQNQRYQAANEKGNRRSAVVVVVDAVAVAAAEVTIQKM